MGICTPWSDSYIYNLREPSGLNHQTFVKLISKTVLCQSNLDKTPKMNCSLLCLQFLFKIFLDINAMSLSATYDENKNQD